MTQTHTAIEEAAIVRFAIERGLITPAQVEECGRIRGQLIEDGLEPRSLLEILCMKGYLSEKRLQSREEENRFAELVIQAGLVTFEQVRECRKIQKTERLEEILVRKGYLTEEKLDILLGN